MSILNKVFGYSDPLGNPQYDPYAAGLRNHNNAAQNAAYNQAAVNQQLGMQQAMAGGGMSGVAMGQISASGLYNQWGQQLSPTQIREKTRNHIANEVEKMAEEIGAPTLLHAVVLAIRTMEIPE